MPFRIPIVAYLRDMLSILVTTATKTKEQFLRSRNRTKFALFAGESMVFRRHNTSNSAVGGKFETWDRCLRKRQSESRLNCSEKPMDEISSEKNEQKASATGGGECDVGKMETSLCSMKIIEEDTSEIDETKKLWESEQVRLKALCCLEDTEPWEINRVALGMMTSSEESTDVTPLRYVAGTDISFVKENQTNACAAIVVVELPSLEGSVPAPLKIVCRLTLWTTPDPEVVYEDISMVELTAPYIPGFLAFREADFLIKKLEQLQQSRPDIMPQAIIADGNGILHPRGFGLACHIGVQLGIPTVGAAKTLYHVDGIEKNEDHQNKIKALSKKGDQFPLVGQSGQTLGVALRSCDKSTNPVYISPGHNISMETAVWLVQLCCKYRVPEPVRQADIKSRQYIRDNWKSDVA